MPEITRKEVIDAGKIFLGYRPTYYDAVKRKKQRVGTRLKWDFETAPDELSVRAFSDWLEERGLKLETIAGEDRQWWGPGPAPKARPAKYVVVIMN